jgi:hypothetical protein
MSEQTACALTFTDLRLQVEVSTLLGRTIGWEGDPGTLQFSEELLNMLFDELPDSSESLEVFAEGIWNIPLDEAAAKVLGKTADDSVFHLHYNVHLSQGHFLETFGSVPLE